MSDVFVSYKREDRERVQALVEALRRIGLSVWWDQDIPPAAHWEHSITAALDAARCVIVCWTRHSIDSIAGQKVQVEAREAQDGNKLLQVLLEDVRPPLFFRQSQAVDLCDWFDGNSHPKFQMLAQAAKDVVRGQRPALPKPNRSTRAYAPEFSQSFSTQVLGNRYVVWALMAVGAIVMALVGNAVLGAFGDRPNPGNAGQTQPGQNSTSAEQGSNQQFQAPITQRRSEPPNERSASQGSAESRDQQVASLPVPVASDRTPPSRIENPVIGNHVQQLDQYERIFREQLAGAGLSGISCRGRG